jgi:phosphate transport system substrate-binding protein
VAHEARSCPSPHLKEINLNLKRPWVRTLMTLSLGGTLLLTACSSGSNSPSAGGSTGGSSASGVSGSVDIHGSSTVEPITSSVAEKFAADNPGFDFVVGDEGTGDGFADFFCTGDSDISDASRQIKEEEVAECADAGVEYTELQVGYDGLSVITSVDDADITCLSFLDIYALLGPESEGFAKWSDANDLAATLAGELGTDFGESHAPYPDADITIAGPGEESGTFDSFNELVIAGIAEARGLPEEQWIVRPDYTSSSNDNDIVTGIGGSPSSLGWVGLHFAEENASTIKALEVDGGDGCVAPNSDTVSDKTYPISRPLFFYVNNDKVATNAALAPFVDFYLSDDGISSVTEEGYVALPDDQLADIRAAWDSM